MYLSSDSVSNYQEKRQISFSTLHKLCKGAPTENNVIECVQIKYPSKAILRRASVAKYTELGNTATSFLGTFNVEIPVPHFCAIADYSKALPNLLFPAQSFLLFPLPASKLPHISLNPLSIILSSTPQWVMWP